MSSESYFWLATNVLAGFADTRRPWWADAAERQGYATNLFPAEVPIERVQELLTSWSPIVANALDEDEVIAKIREGHAGPDLIREIEAARIDTHKLIKASDTSERMAMVGIDHAIHTYRDWLTGTVIETVGDEAQISSAGLLRSRAQAWVQIERPDTAVGPDGIKFSPYLTLSTSLDGSLASQINQNVQMVICDNTLRIGRDQGLASRIKHTKGSAGRLGVHRGIMTALMAGESDFKAELERQLSTEVPDTAFQRFIEAFVPVDEDDHPAKKTRSERKRREITELYKGDARVAAWRGTEFGVVQAVNTWQQHLSQLANRTGYEMDDTNLRAMRNYAQRLTTPKGESPDMATARVLESVL